MVATHGKLIILWAFGALKEVLSWCEGQSSAQIDKTNSKKKNAVIYPKKNVSVTYKPVFYIYRLQTKFGAR